MEYRTAEDGEEYTYEEFTQWYGKMADNEWRKAGVEYTLYIHIDYSMSSPAPSKVVEELKDRNELRDKYIYAINEWNNSVSKATHTDVGFNLFTPKDEVRRPDDFNDLYTIDFALRATMFKKNLPVSFSIHPTHSLFSPIPPYRLSHISLIPPSHPSTLQAHFDVLFPSTSPTPTPTPPPPFYPFVHICAPLLRPFFVELI